MKTFFVAGIGLAGLLLGAITPALAQDDATQLQTLVEKTSPAIVTIKLVLKTETKFGGNSRDSESRMELQGVVVDKSGLVMISNAAFSPGRFMAMFAGGGGEDGPSIKATPTDFKIVFAQEEKEYPGFLAATDTKLDLAFIQIEELAGRTLTAVDFNSNAVAALGQRIASVSRLAKGYDYAPYFSTARIGGAISKPRKAFMLDGRAGDFGLPIFTMGGEVLGVLTTVESGVKSDGGDGGFGFAMRMMTGGGGGGSMGAFIIPAQTVYGVIGQAKVRAVKLAEDRAKNKTTKPTTKPDGGKATTTKPKKP